MKYSEIVFGHDEPDAMWIPSPLGPIMLTREGHFLCDHEGNVIGEVSRDYAADWFKKIIAMENRKKT